MNSYARLFAICFCFLVWCVLVIMLVSCASVDMTSQHGVSATQHDPWQGLRGNPECDGLCK